MIDMVFQNQKLILSIIFLTGIADGLLLWAWVLYLYWMIGRHTQRQEHTRRTGREDLMEVGETGIEVQHKQAGCVDCWEELHSGLMWRGHRRTRCVRHLLELEDIAA